MMSLPHRKTWISPCCFFQELPHLFWIWKHFEWAGSAFWIARLPMHTGQIRIHLFLRLLYICAKLLFVCKVCSLLPVGYFWGPAPCPCVPISMCTLLWRSQFIQRSGNFCETVTYIWVMGSESENVSCEQETFCGMLILSLSAWCLSM